MQRLKAVILDYQSLAPSDLQLDALWNLPIDWVMHDATPSIDTAARIEGMDIVLTNKVVLDATLLNNNPQLKLVIILATGTNNVDLLAAKLRHLPVCNIVGYSTESVVQHTFASLLSLYSRLIEYDRAVKAGAWSQSQFFGLLNYPIHEVSGKTMGIIGYGTIGRRVKIVAEALGIHVLIAKSLVGNASEEGRVSLEEIYTQSDIISIHSPLSDASRNLINASAFAQMKPSAVLLNMGRGGIVNEQDLLFALQNGIIAAAATDVLVQEPPAADHFLLSSGCERLIVTPHTAWASQEARQVLVHQVESILQGFLQGKLVNQV